MYCKEYLLTPWSPYYTAYHFSASQEILHILWIPKVHYRTHKEPATCPYHETNIKLNGAKALFFQILQIPQTMTQDICSAMSAAFLSGNVVITKPQISSDVTHGSNLGCYSNNYTDWATRFTSETVTKW
jgi:hypothetical protein